ncbi:hypothetical protein AM1_0663 [Acaryochloris marina MBIC11017]|uniref:Trypsin-like peptidase domain-containing protein n=2 Tax=Acaryochloris marina TaxID=155978 RepID=B0CE76_ACAM1|nr:hypothetical protein AM1_0663 [Acaryochloris marina MBIC11017]
MGKRVTISPLSISSMFIELLYDDISLGSGSAFYLKNNNRLYLISNWHNYSGRNPKTRKPIHKECAIPNKVKVYSYNETDQGFAIEEKVYDLLDNNEISTWYEHCELGSKVDVAALPINDEDLGDVIDIERAIELVDPYDSETIKISDSLFILGYPFGLRVNDSLPIWKSATVASEPEIDCGSVPMFYIDTATKAGMSGAPVIMYRKRAIPIFGDGKSSVYHAEFIGIYSGRVIPRDLIEVQLGKVWKKSCLPSVLNGSKYSYFA